MTLSIIIVNWNVKDLLEKCLASVYKETRNIRFEVIVIDNASGDGSAEMIRKKFPQVNLIENKENRWFAGGNNQGFKISKGELILLLNPDTEILDGAIEKMAEMMKGGIKNQELRIKNMGKNEENKLEIGNWKLKKKSPFPPKRRTRIPLRKRGKYLISVCWDASC
ncbi:MAG: glycosyltransferase family 2 protein [bacterium]